MFLARKRKVFFINILAVLFLVIFLLPNEAGATPSGCSDAATGPEVRSCCGTDRDSAAASHAGWSCQNAEGRESECAPGLCPGGATNMCCPPAAGGEEGEGGGGSSVRESLKTAARGADLSTGGSVSGIIQRVISTVLGFVGVIFLVLIIVGGLTWMTAGGNEDQVGKSKKLITNAVIGTIIIMLAYVLVSFVMGKIVG